MTTSSATSTISNRLRNPALLCSIALLASATAYVRELVRAISGGGRPSHDLYQYYVPNMLLAAQRIRDGGHGLLWNDLVDCGQPFLGMSFTGLLYPLNALFLALPPDAALLTIMVLHFTIAGVGAALLAREIGVGWAGMMGAALAFQLGNGSIDLTTWGPQMSGPYVWWPLALLFCERILRAPTARRIIALGAVLGITLLPGFPQTVLYLYQLIALRVVWALAWRESPRPLASTLGVIAGMMLAPLLVALPLIPGIENAALSVRNAVLTSAAEINPQGSFTWKAFRGRAWGRSELQNPLAFLPWIFSLSSLTHRSAALRRVSMFFLIVGALSFALGFGPDAPLFDLYAKLPVVGLFRDPPRIFWITSACLAILCGIAIDALVGTTTASEPLSSTAPALSPPLPAPASTIRKESVLLVGSRLLLIAVTCGIYYWLVGGRVTRLEWRLGGAALATSILVTIWRGSRPAAAVVLVGVLFLSLGTYRKPPFRKLMPSIDQLRAQSATFEKLKSRVTPQERIFLGVKPFDFELQWKTGSLFGLPSMFDYEPQPSRRFAEYWVYLKKRRPLASLNDFYYPKVDTWAGVGQARMLFDHSASKYYLAKPPLMRSLLTSAPPLSILDHDGPVWLLENPAAMPRAYFVPSSWVIASPLALLERLANPFHDPLQSVLLEAAPVSGFSGQFKDQPRLSSPLGQVDFLRNDPESVALQVEAPTRGFLVLADQFFPGWKAAVNGSPTEILRANYLFRAVEVPAGQSVVQFYYRPLSVRVGAWISGLTITGACMVLWWDRRRRTRSELVSSA